MSDSAAAARELKRNVKRRGRARGKGRASRKDAVLHLRIEAEIMERIKTQATSKGVSISDLVRWHLAEHFGSSDSSESGTEPGAGFLEDAFDFIKDLAQVFDVEVECWFQAELSFPGGTFMTETGWLPLVTVLDGG